MRYRLLLSLFAFFVLAGLILRRRWTELRARLGAVRGTPGAHVWVHAASNGELASARPVIQALLDDAPDRQILITCNSQTGVSLAQTWGLPRVTARLAPLDLAWVTRRFMRTWSVTALLLLESELWPNRIALCPGPVLLISARLTEKTARMWARLGRTVGRTLQRIAFAAPQDSATGQRLRDLGLPDTAMGDVVTLKALYQASPLPDTPEIRALQKQFLRTDTWLAASTHAGEDGLVFAAHQTARQARPGLRLILAPRHPKRAPEIIQAATDAGLSIAQRSAQQTPNNEDIYLVDTLGEMGIWYALSGTVFIGGSLIDKGGHTPFEPGAYKCALLHGPHVGNFTDAYAVLHQAGATTQVTDGAQLADALIALTSPAIQSTLGQTAHDALARDTGFDSTMQQVLRLLNTA